MSEKEKAANQNISFSELMHNPERERAEGEIARLIVELEVDGMDPSIISDSLFELLMIQMAPSQPVTGDRAVTWFAKLQRYRERLSSQIQEVEDLYKNV